MKQEWRGVNLTDVEVGWLAGLLEGEGCFGFYQYGTRRAFRLSLNMTDEDVVKRAHVITGVGSVSCKKSRGENYKPIWLWLVCGQEALMVMEIIYPHMGNRRRAKIAEVVGQYQAYLRSTPRRGTHTR